MEGSTLVTFPESGHSTYWEVHEEFNRVVDVPPSVVPHPMLELEPTAGQEVGAF
jgi:hypothetical protein